MKLLDNDIMVLPLDNSNKLVYVDKDIYYKAIQHKWFINKNGYVFKRKDRTSRHGRYLTLTEFITGKTFIDHKDRDKLNNLRSNFREASTLESAANRGKQNGKYTSKYKGVCFIKTRIKKKWLASITRDWVTYNLGYFENELEAAKAYNEAAKKYHGEFACLNNL